MMLSTLSLPEGLTRARTNKDSISAELDNDEEDDCLSWEKIENAPP